MFNNKSVVLLFKQIVLHPISDLGGLCSIILFQNKFVSCDMLQHHQQHSAALTQGYYDYNMMSGNGIGSGVGMSNLNVVANSAPSASSITDSMNTTPFSVKDILNMVNQNDIYDPSYGHFER